MVPFSPGFVCFFPFFLCTSRFFWGFFIFFYYSLGVFQRLPQRPFHMYRHRHNWGFNHGLTHGKLQRVVAMGSKRLLRRTAGERHRTSWPIWSLTLLSPAPERTSSPYTSSGQSSAESFKNLFYFHRESSLSTWLHDLDAITNLSSPSLVTLMSIIGGLKLSKLWSLATNSFYGLCSRLHLTNTWCSPLQPVTELYSVCEVHRGSHCFPLEADPLPPCPN